MLAVIIVSWNVRELLRRCLLTLQADANQSQVAMRTIVVDSASQDGSAQIVQREFPDVELVARSENIGYVRGNNLAMQKAKEDSTTGSHLEYIWLLNPDTEVKPGAIVTLVEFMRQHPRCGLCGPRLLNADGSLQDGAFAFPGLVQLALETQPFLWRLRGTRLDGRYARTQYTGDMPFQIGHPLGAAMFARAIAVEQVGMLDPGFEMYAEEVDWAMRMKRAGWERWCVPAAQVVHYGGASSGQASERSELIKWRSRQRYYAKHYPALKRFIAMRLVPKQYRGSGAIA